MRRYLPTGTLGFLLCVAACEATPSVSGPAAPEAMMVSSVEDARWPLTPSQRRVLREVGLTQIGMPFGVLVGADRAMPRAFVLQAVGIVAEMMDQDGDGVVDDPEVAAFLGDREVCWLAMPMDPRRWERSQLPRLERVLGYDIIIPEWWMDIRGTTPDEHARAVMVEEIHHFITQFGYSQAYPDLFGVEDWNSVIARETRRARCDFWQHPENDCPGRPAEIEGDCRDPSCDVVEFYHQVVVTRADMTPGWRGIGFPVDANALEARLDPAVIRIMDDPRYHQLRRPLRFDYPVGSVDPEVPSSGTY